MTRPRSRSVALATVTSLAAAAAAHAQWSATVLSTGPMFPSGSAEAHAIHAGQIVGNYQRPGENIHAYLWTSPTNAIDLHPAGAVHSWAYGVHNGRQVGVQSGKASLWYSDPTAFTLHDPMQGGNSMAVAVHGNWQVGRTGTGTQARATLWMGTSQSQINLHPAGGHYSEALGVHNEQVVGFVNVGATQPWRDHAALWTGPSSAWIDLNPPGATYSRARAVWNGRQVGEAQFETGGPRVVLWSGTASSYTILESRPDNTAVAMHGGYQAGHYLDGSSFPLMNKACVWRSAPGTREDLSSVLHPAFVSSWATGVWSNGTTVFVVGTASTSSGETDAILWTRAIPCPTDWNADGAVNSADISTFLTAWLDSIYNSNFNGDFNHDEIPDSTDISLFLSTWLSDVTSGGC